MIFTAIKWFALLKGAWWVLKPRPRMIETDMILRHLYIDPIRKALNRPMIDWETELFNPETDIRPRQGIFT